MFAAELDRVQIADPIFCHALFEMLAADQEIERRRTKGRP
jgi:hypothetical protein